VENSRYARVFHTRQWSNYNVSAIANGPCDARMAVEILSNMRNITFHKA